MTTAVEFQHTMDRFIELYGDRTGEIGDAIRGGLAWIEDTKVVLLGGNREAVYHLSDWRRFSRLVGLAQQLRRPVLLWNLSFRTETIAQQDSSLVVHHAFQNSQLQLLKLSYPIIGVFDNYQYRVSLESELATFDGAVLVESDNSPLSNERSFSSRIKIASCQEDAKVKIAHLLNQVSVIPAGVLVSDRIDRIQRITFSSRLKSEASKDIDL